MSTWEDNNEAVREWNANFDRWYRHEHRKQFVYHYGSWCLIVLVSILLGVALAHV